MIAAVVGGDQTVALCCYGMLLVDDAIARAPPRAIITTLAAHCSFFFAAGYPLPDRRAALLLHKSTRTDGKPVEEAR